MTNANANIRKAAVLIRSLDADTAASLLAQLAPDEATAVRAASRELGPLDPEEQADVAAEFHRTAPVAHEALSAGVELALTATARHDADEFAGSPPASGRRFEFLEHAPTEALVPYLAREHVQTIAVVLSYLAPGRAAAVLAALPAALQAETIERLSALGETDPDSLTVVERELSAWLAKRSASRHGSARRSDTVMSILAVADVASRDGIMTSLKTHKAPLAKQIAPLLPIREPKQPEASQAANLLKARASALENKEWGTPKPPSSPSPAPNPQRPTRPPTAPVPRISFDDLVRLSPSELARLLHDVDPNVLVLALAGSSEELVDRLCIQMPRRAAKAFRRQLGRFGPTRLSDVEAAQRLVAGTAALRLGERRALAALTRR